jgi:hypothetical protein
VLRIVWISVAGVDYRYELRRADELIATGHLNHDPVGDEVEIGGQPGERELRLVIQVSPDRS